MISHLNADDFLNGIFIEDSIFELRPDYRAGVLVVQGIKPKASSDFSESLLERAEKKASELLTNSPVEELPHIAEWRKTYVSFGAKPQRTRNSLEALTRRAEQGLPRVNLLTDIYNAISVYHQIPLGGEDLDKYSGSPKLIRATGSEPFQTSANGENLTEFPEPGEVIWTDENGITCRRWNWRQSVSTRLEEKTINAVFILDALSSISDDYLEIIISDLSNSLKEISEDLVFNHRIFTSTSS